MQSQCELRCASDMFLSLFYIGYAAHSLRPGPVAQCKLVLHQENLKLLILLFLDLLPLISRKYYFF